MNLGIWALVLPVLQLATALWLIRRVHWRRYPALLLYLTGDAAAITANVLFAHNWYGGWLAGQPFRMLLRAALCFEILYFGCVRLNAAERLRALGAVAATSLSAGAATAMLVKLTPWQSLLIFRQYFHLELAAIVAGMNIYLWRNPIGENAEHRAYRQIGSLILVRIAISGLFVPAGFGYLLFPYTRATWLVADALSWATAAALVVLLGWRMTSSFSSQTPERAYARAVRSSFTPSSGPGNPPGERPGRW